MRVSEGRRRELAPCRGEVCDAFWAASVLAGVAVTSSGPVPSVTLDKKAYSVVWTIFACSGGGVNGVVGGTRVGRGGTVKRGFWLGETLHHVDLRVFW